MALATMQKAHLDSVRSDVHGKISKKTVELDTVKVTRVRFDVGAKWSADLRNMLARAAVFCRTWPTCFRDRSRFEWTMGRKSCSAPAT